MSNFLPLREQKKYQTMSNILDSFLSSLDNKNFSEILVEDICKQVQISKVTFFRYFSSKEEVLDYFVLRWCFQRSIEISQNLFEGIDGIRHVFRSAAEIPKALKILVALVHYYSKLKTKPERKDLPAYELYVISQGSEEIQQVQVLSLTEIFSVYLSQMNSLDPSALKLYIQHLLSLFYGIPFQIHIQMLAPDELLKAYMENLDLLFAEKTPPVLPRT